MRGIRGGHGEDMGPRGGLYGNMGRDKGGATRGGGAQWAGPDLAPPPPPPSAAPIGEAAAAAGSFRPRAARLPLGVGGALLGSAPGADHSPPGVGPAHPGSGHALGGRSDGGGGAWGGGGGRGRRGRRGGGRGAELSPTGGTPKACRDPDVPRGTLWGAPKPQMRWRPYGGGCGGWRNPIGSPKAYWDPMGGA